ncbi:hypothetical protein PoB_000421800 [Plakobranchus ocellatus]|uniref:Uncharacterized protein n=1 Tax=Plakobranchus ocellatus TaxID=259542 RepID=A0AAV3Y5K1_9GAST|nr:hypothetical protein PoB_000421800 [Plakobranchus ocellatus]
MNAILHCVGIPNSQVPWHPSINNQVAPTASLYTYRVTFFILVPRTTAGKVSSRHTLRTRREFNDKRKSRDAMMDGLVTRYITLGDYKPCRK